MTGASATVSVTVELFGSPRILGGAKAFDLAVPAPVSRENLIAALADRCPALVGHGLRDDLTDLEEGYVFNRNGLAFLGDGEFAVEDGDSLLLISSQAGG
ncbi:MAG: MoaD/ThiS family protein [Chloroflexi bacterium]|nr:MoaD/ThiS family protein [Chloroflexota bacterium]